MTPEYGPSHILGDHSAGSYRRWWFGGGPERARAAEATRRLRERRATALELWHRVHGRDVLPPGTLRLTNYLAGATGRIAADCWAAWDRLSAHLDGERAAEARLREYLDEMRRDDLATLERLSAPPQTNTDNAAGPRAGHSTQDEGSALPASGKTR